ncbi:MAG: hypothetical protein AAGK78_13895 [Planctomycetota bacterium]
MSASDPISRHANEQAPRGLHDLTDERRAETDNKKICRLCGKDLRGHKRYKDKDGYLCKDCNKEDLAQRIPCAECGAPTLPHALHPWGPISICSACKNDHENDPNKKFRRKVSTKKHETHELKKVIVIGAIVAGLGAVVLLSRIGC